MWYINIAIQKRSYTKLPYHPRRLSPLIQGLLWGILIMLVLSSTLLFIIPSQNYGTMMLMLQVRGIFIHFTFYMFIQLLAQNAINQEINLQLERSKTNRIWAQYELLKQQINPHFLFNSLNTLKYMVENQNLKAVDFILKLSKFYRYTLKNRQLNTISLGEELKILKIYNYLLITRFEEGLHIDIQVKEFFKTTIIPPFTLQLLVENAVKHNVVSQTNPLFLKIYTDEEFVCIENKICAKKSNQYSMGIGLKNIRERYQLLFNREIIIVTENQKFIVKIPIIYECTDY
ncbi:sensor histidine kinase [Flavobacterium sp. HSC-61S13]|uniref:sensor histidine kinase n=1 Tax=Flavobacterium sp. HSC-61S13 TaxID=2910963 RepID=UPI0020A048B5|nr:histidine kinase [Flavobacterium sp. HSC-61S13]MCP1996792.1 LytS/YehU family sensor histidine kinase [Flavobacterium sp. HSC-61S13]